MDDYHSHDNVIRRARDQVWRAEIEKYVPELAYMSFAGPESVIRWVMEKIGKNRHLTLLDPDEKILKEFEDVERHITGQSWKDCPTCKQVRIPFDHEGPCQNCGGKIVNCWACGAGSRWWVLKSDGSYICSACRSNPLEKKD